MNVELLERVKQHILEEPRRLDMGWWVVRDEGILGANLPPCGTVGCIAGWAVLLAGEDVSDVSDVGIRAAELLDIPNPGNLFYESRWPEDLAYAIELLEPQTQEYAEVTASRIDRFIQTNGRE